MDPRKEQSIFRFTDEVRLVQLEQARRLEIQPLLDIKVQIFSTALPKMTMYEDGRMTTEYKFPPATQAVLDQLDEMLATVQKRYQAMRIGIDDRRGR